VFIHIAGYGAGVCKFIKRPNLWSFGVQRWIVALHERMLSLLNVLVF